LYKLGDSCFLFFNTIFTLGGQILLVGLPLLLVGSLLGLKIFQGGPVLVSSLLEALGIMLL